MSNDNVVEFPKKSELDKQFEQLESQADRIANQAAQIQDLQDKSYKETQRTLVDLNADGQLSDSELD